MKKINFRRSFPIYKAVACCSNSKWKDMHGVDNVPCPFLLETMCPMPFLPNCTQSQSMTVRLREGSRNVLKMELEPQLFQATPLLPVD